MLVDKIKQKEWAQFSFYSKNISLKNAIVFRVEESISEFINNRHYLAGKETQINKIKLPSFLPYNNLAINYTDGLDWFYQTEHKKMILIINPYFCETRLTVNGNIFHSTPKPFLLADKNMSLINLGLLSVQDLRFITIFEIEKLYGRGEVFDVVYAFLWGLLRFLDFLSCKNIVFDKKTPPIKLQRKRAKKNKLPLSSYYTLKIKPTSSKKDHDNKNLWSNRIHLCRGHIKTYTEERPLFGKIVGNIWCPPHARGNKKNGVIHKDYLIKGE